MTGDGVIKSLLYDDPAEGYREDLECVWHITAEPNSVLLVRFMDVFRVLLTHSCSHELCR